MKQIDFEYPSTLNCPILPRLPEVLFRGFQGKSDFPHMAAVIEASKDVDGIERVTTVDDIQNTYAHLHNCDAAADMIFAQVDGRVVGYGRCHWDANGDGHWLGFTVGFLHPQWRRKGIGSAMLRFLQARLRQICAALIAQKQLDPAAPRFFDTESADTQIGQDALLRADGYQIVRYGLLMTRPNLEAIPDLPLPAGMEVRPALPEHYRAIWDASNEAFRDHWGYIPEPEEAYAQMLASPNFDPSLWRVAWDGDQIAGMVLSYIDKAENETYQRRRGYTENICVRRPWRKRGLAKALIALSLQALKAYGMEHAALGVDAENLSGAMRLYESMGYRKVKQFGIYRKPLA